MVQSGRAGYDCFTSLRGDGPPQGPGSGGGYSTIDSEVTLPRLGASWVPREATYRASVEFPQILSHERTLSMPLSFLLHQQEEVEDDFAEDLPRGEQPVPVVEVERTSAPDSSPSVPPPTAPAPPETTGSSSTSQQPSKLLDAVRALATTTASLAASQTALVERMDRVEVTLVQNQAILLQIQSHLGLPPVTVTEPIQLTTHDRSSVSASAASLDMLAAAAVASNPPASTPPVE